MNDSSSMNVFNTGDLLTSAKEMTTCFKTEPPDTEDDESKLGTESSSEYENTNTKVKIEKEWPELESTLSSEGPQANDSKIIKLEGNTTQYRCGICEFISDTFYEMREHKKLHNIEKRTCAMCGMVCQSIGKLEVHQNAHFGIKPCVCDQCGKSYSSSTQLKIHKRIHTDEKRYKCNQCDEAFRYNGTLRSHIRMTHTKILLTTCKVCSRYCETQEDLKEHMRTVHPKEKKSINCQLCQKTFKSEQLLSCHLKVHTELKFPCEFCQRIYPTLYRLKKHVGRAHIPNVCECKQVFYDRSEFTKHNKEFHKTEEPTHCQYCNKNFDKPKNLTEHIRLQHRANGKVNKCKICEKEFINASLLRNHVKIHVKSFKCEYCDKIFGSRYNLQIHLVVHTKERKFQCDECGNYYGTKTALKNHKFTHLEVKNFTCDICNKKFKSNHRLYAHKSLHEAEKKHECEICHAKFTIKQYLNFHMKKHSKEKPFECKPCQRKFKHKRSFEKHCLLQRHKNAVRTWVREGDSDDSEKNSSMMDCSENGQDETTNDWTSSTESNQMGFEEVKLEVKVEPKNVD
ncbi:zinc finger protein 58-like [Coccinella septempunctata]|uniref:zinc finger protein 58-like n=1 Tax=Coccinella septempunctata TaxID=41139 RepID=UPI001D06C55A|nr:zinc finger protein 58-like [Coccinella septempunctata]